MIPFTQYVRPDGRRREIEIAADETTEESARKLIERGYRFEAEVLVTGEVSLTVSDGEEDVAIELCHNGPDIQEAVVRLIRSVP